MKNFFYIPTITLLLTCLCTCKNTSYSKLLKEENKIIENYIKREHIRTSSSLPDNNLWPEDFYYTIPEYDNMYFHLDSQGDSIIILNNNGTPDTIHNLPITSMETVVVRFKKFTLTYPADTIMSNWTTLDNATPTEFKYNDFQDANACVAWHTAVRLMKYSDSQCTIICPSKQGFVEDQYKVVPYGYILKIKIKR